MTLKEILDRSFRGGIVVLSIAGLFCCGPNLPELLKQPVAVAAGLAVVLSLILPFER